MKLIDANNLRKEICKLFPNKMPYDYNEDDNDLGAILCDVGAIIDKQPIIEVDSVVHAKWVDCLDSISWTEWEEKVKCSYCGKTNKKYKSPYCPHCGAKMDKW